MVTTEKIKEILKQVKGNIEEVSGKLKELDYLPNYDEWARKTWRAFMNLSFEKVEWSPENTIINIILYKKEWIREYTEKHTYEYEFYGYYDEALDRIYSLEKLPEEIKYVMFRGKEVPDCIVDSRNTFGLNNNFKYKGIKLPFELFLTKKITINLTTVVEN